MKKQSKKIYRSAESGKIVSAKTAKANPKTTVKETVKPAPIRFDYAMLSKDILEFRQTKDKSFTDLEKETNVKRTTLYRLEAGQYKTDIETILNVCKGIKKNISKYLSCFIIASLLFAAPAIAQGKGKGAVSTITVDLSEVAGNVAKVVLVNESTGATFESYGGELDLPKKGSYTVWLYMYNSEGSEINYWIDLNGSGVVGITMQPGEPMRGAGALNVDLDRGDLLYLRRM